MKNKIKNITNSIFKKIKNKNRRGSTKLDILAKFPFYRPYGTGDYKTLASLTLDGINCFPKALLSLNKRSISVKKISDLINNEIEYNQAQKFKEAFDLFGSDKANPHDYYIFYSHILQENPNVKNIFEIGLGTKNTQVASHMRKSGKTGGSLRAFSSLFPNAKVYGADVDKSVLFNEKEIKTFYVDQNRKESFSKLENLLPSEFDLMIDDGLHAVHANLHSLEFFLRKTKVNGWSIIEDISRESIEAWLVVQNLIPQNYYSQLFESKCGSLIFAVQRKS